MSARANTLRPGSAALAAGRAEHISIESAPDEHQPSIRPAKRRVCAAYTLTSAIHGCSTELSILEDHYLSVRSSRSRGEAKDYVLDLRFANAKPVLVRRIAWGWFATTALLAAASAGAMWWSARSAGNVWVSEGFFIGTGALLAAAGAAVFFWRKTTESLEFTSMHGSATLVSVTGAIGSGKAGRVFFVDLIKNISAAKLARPQARQQFLRDEMREHHRLRELGVLTEEDYETSKARILQAHS